MIELLVAWLVAAAVVLLIVAEAVRADDERAERSSCENDFSDS